MNLESKYIKPLLILVHVILGFGGIYPVLIKIYTIVAFILALIYIYKNKDKNQEVMFWCAYFVGIEVFFRMSRSSLSYEFTKYAVIIFVLIGMVTNLKKQKIVLSYFLYLILLLIGIIFTDVPPGESIRKAVVFNLSGPFCLGMVALYFYKRQITKKEIFDAMFYILLPIFSTLAYMYLKTPDLKDIEFTGSANYEMSGGFGPNQVATILGLGMFIVAVFLFFKIKLTGFILIDLGVLLYLTYRGLLTFSRGGVFVGIFAFIVLIMFVLFYSKEYTKKIIQLIFFSAILTGGIWFYTVEVTGGMLENRYAGKNANGVKKEDITSGRIDIFISQIESFYNSPFFGIGVGNGKYDRLSSTENITAASHNEISRLIEEHGLMGIIILLILFTVPIAHMFYANYFQKAFLLAFFLFWILTINHSAMRIAFPSFIYGLSLVKIIDDEEDEEDDDE